VSPAVERALGLWRAWRELPRRSIESLVVYVALGSERDAFSDAERAEYLAAVDAARTAEWVALGMLPARKEAA
jgi:hypothetical protein